MKPGDRIEVWFCSDCMFMQETGGEGLEDIGPSRSQEVEACLVELHADYHVFNDSFDSDDSCRQGECATCFHTGSLHDFVVRLDDEGDFEAFVCPECGSDHTGERSDGRLEFSWRPCGCCGSTLGGSRERYALFRKEKVDGHVELTR